MWISRNSNLPNICQLSDENLKGILLRLEKLGGCALVACDFLKQKAVSKIWDSRPSWRIPLIQHVIALFFFELVFEPFVFGFPPEASKALNYIDNDIIRGGIFPLNKLLM